MATVHLARLVSASWQAGVDEFADRGCGLVRAEAQFAAQQALPVYPAAAGDFVATAINLRLRFAGGNTARPSELTVVNGSKTESFRRAD